MTKEAVHSAPAAGEKVFPDKEAATSLPSLCFLVFLAVLPVTLLVPVLKPLVADRYPVGAFAVHAFMSINMVGALIAAPVVGWIIDRVGRRRPIVVGTFLADAALLLALNWAPDYTTLIAIRFIEGMTHIAALTSVMGAALALAHRETRRAGGVMGAIGASIIFAVGLGAGLGGFLARGGLWRTMAGAAALSVLGAAISAWTLRRDTGNGRTASRRGLAVLVRTVRQEKAVLIPCLFTFSDRLTVGLLVSSFALYLGQVLERQPSEIGFLLTLLLIPFAILCYPFGKLSRRYSKSVMVAGGSILYGACLVALAFVPPGWLPAGMIFLGVVSAVNFAPSLAMMADLAGPEIRSTAMGAFNSAGSLGFLLGPLIGGAVVQTALSTGETPQTAYTAAFAAGGGLSILVALVAIPSLVRLVRAGRTN